MKTYKVLIFTLCATIPTFASAIGLVDPDNPSSYQGYSFSIHTVDGPNRCLKPRTRNLGLGSVIKAKKEGKKSCNENIHKWFIYQVDAQHSGPKKFNIKSTESGLCIRRNNDSDSSTGMGACDNQNAKWEILADADNAPYSGNHHYKIKEPGEQHCTVALSLLGQVFSFRTQKTLVEGSCSEYNMTFRNKTHIGSCTDTRPLIVWENATHTSHISPREARYVDGHSCEVTGKSIPNSVTTEFVVPIDAGFGWYNGKNSSGICDYGVSDPLNCFHGLAPPNKIPYFHTYSTHTKFRYYLQ